MNNLFTHPYDKFESSFEAMLHLIDVMLLMSEWKSIAM